jgi:hypothetical protein
VTKKDGFTPPFLLALKCFPKTNLAELLLLLVVQNEMLQNNYKMAENYFLVLGAFNM